MLTLTVEHLHFDEAANETVEVYGVLGISVTTDDGLQHCTVELETCGRKTADSDLISEKYNAILCYIEGNQTIHAPYNPVNGKKLYENI